jgi:ABC-type Mn2+/Zn2+ transport system permease subunit
VSVLSVTLGLLTALYVDLPPSSLIIGVLILLFFLQSIALSIRTRKTKAS